MIATAIGPQNTLRDSGMMASTAAAAVSAIGLARPRCDARASERQSGPVSIDHYENFPVASWLCPAALRPAVIAIYHFARTADDIADEGDAHAAARRAALVEYGLALQRAVGGESAGPWQPVFAPLATVIARHRLPLQAFTDLLSAFTQDTDNPLYADRAALLEYCSRSANPIGRLLLHLSGVDDKQSLAQSDAVCSALQLINFWQDLSIDLPRKRCYITRSDAEHFGLDVLQLEAGRDSPASRALVLALCEWARETMLVGAPLVHRLPGRLGWELRFVVQGGLRVLDRIEASGGNAFSLRPTLGKSDAPRLAWRALRMGVRTPAAPTRALPSDQALR